MLEEGSEPTELSVAPRLSQAQNWLTDYLREEECDQPKSKAIEWLNELVNHHLLQRSAGDRIEFRHQFIQEYYAAEYLLSRLPKLDDVTLQRDYLNYLKWTEPFILLLGLLENRKQALRIVKLAEAIDWPLAARLAGAVHPDWQKEAILIAITPQIPEWHRLQLYGLTRSQDAVPALAKVLSKEDGELRKISAQELGNFNSETVLLPLCAALKDSDLDVRHAAVTALFAMVLNGIGICSNKQIIYCLGDVLQNSHDNDDLLRLNATLDSKRDWQRRSGGSARYCTAQ
jgi:hypothetical protein